MRQRWRTRPLRWLPTTTVGMKNTRMFLRRWCSRFLRSNTDGARALVKAAVPIIGALEAPFPSGVHTALEHAISHRTYRIAIPL